MLILFDLDDTLVNHTAAYRAATAALHRQVGPNEVESVFVERWSTAHRRYFDLYLAGQLTYEEQYRARVRDAIDVEASDEEADAIFGGYIADYEAGWELFADVTPCLDELAPHRLGVITNGQRRQQMSKLERTGIASRFQCVLTPGDCGAAKPAPQIFHEACRRLGGRIDEAVYVGDAYDLDAKAAQQAGLVGVWLNRTDTAVQADDLRTIFALGELPALLATLETRGVASMNHHDIDRRRP